MIRLGHLSGKQDQKIMEIGKAFKIFLCWTQLLVHVLEKFVQSIIAWVKRYYGGVTKLIIEKYSKISREIHEDYSLWNYFNYTVLSCPKFKRVTNEGEEMCSPKLWVLFQACFQKGFDPIQYIAKCCNLLKRIKGHVLIGFEIYSS